MLLEKKKWARYLSAPPNQYICKPVTMNILFMLSAANPHRLSVSLSISLYAYVYFLCQETVVGV